MSTTALFDGSGKALKHIVYKTTRPATGEYYLGKHTTKKVEDGYQGSGRWVSACRRAGIRLDTEVLAVFGTEREALEYERHLVTADLLRLDPLCRNQTRGGRGSFLHLVGVPRSEAAKASVSRTLTALYAAMTDDERFASRSRFHGQKRPDHAERMKADANPFFGRTHSAQTREAIAKSRSSAERAEIAKGNTNVRGRRWFNDGVDSFMLHENEGTARGLALGRIGGWMRKRRSPIDV